MDDHRKRQKLEVIANSKSRDYRNVVESYALDEDKDLVKLGSRKSEMECISQSNPCLDLSISLLCRSPSARSATRCFPSFCRFGLESNQHLHYFAVYDGHGCSHVASKCKERLHKLAKEELERMAESALLNDWKCAMERSIRRMDKEVGWYSENVSGSNCRCLLQPPECDRVGSTAVAAILTPEKIIISNCGDLRAVLCRSGKPVPLSSE